MITTVIFDMNGVITDDEEIHEMATKEIFEQIGYDITPAIYREYCLGRTDVAAFKDIADKLEIENQDLNELISLKSIKYQELIKGNLKVYPGVVQLIKDLSNSYTLALTSSSTTDEINTVVEVLEIKKLFKTIVSSQDVVYGKPHPEPYLLTAQKLDVDVNQCLVIEDSENGIKSAKQAGMICIAIPNTEDRNKLIEADRVIATYSEVTDGFISGF